MTRGHAALVEGQFGPQASAYVSSAVHASGEDLDAIEAIAARARPSRALDLGCGGGHVALRLAQHAASVTACDLSSEMLAAVAALARDKGIATIETRVATAEALPFEDATFDFLASRFSCHHWLDLDAGLREARRVLARGAPALLVDSISPGTPVLDTHLQAVELLRDVSHVRNHTAAEWLAFCARAGFEVAAARRWRIRIDFPSWIARMRTPDANRDAIRALQAAASETVRAHFAIEADGSFMLDTMLVEARAA